MIRKCQIGTDVKVNSHQPRFFVSCLSLFSAFPASQKVWGLLWGLRFLKAVYACSFLSIYAEFWAYKNGDEGIRTLDLSDANRTLSQLSYAPIAFLKLLNYNLFFIIRQVDFSRL